MYNTCVYKYLISPFIDNWHVYIINKDCHPASSWGSIGAANSFLNVTFHCSLYMYVYKKAFSNNKPYRIGQR